MLLTTALPVLSALLMAGGATGANNPCIYLYKNTNTNLGNSGGGAQPQPLKLCLESLRCQDLEGSWDNSVSSVRGDGPNGEFTGGITVLAYDGKKCSGGSYARPIGYTFGTRNNVGTVCMNDRISSLRVYGPGQAPRLGWNRYFKQGMCSSR